VLFVVALLMLTRVLSYCSGKRDPFGPYMSQIFIHRCIKYKQMWSCTRRDSLIYGVVITAIWTVLVEICNLECRYFKTFNFNDENVGDWNIRKCWTYNLLLLINSLKMARWWPNMWSWYITWSVVFMICLTVFEVVHIVIWNIEAVLENFRT